MLSAPRDDDDDDDDDDIPPIYASHEQLNQDAPPYRCIATRGAAFSQLLIVRVFTSIISGAV